MQNLEDLYQAFTENPENKTVQMQILAQVTEPSLKLLGLIDSKTNLPIHISNRYNTIIPAFTTEDRIETFCKQVPIFHDKVLNITPITVGRWNLHNTITINPSPRSGIELPAIIEEKPYPEHLETQLSEKPLPEEIRDALTKLNIHTNKWFTTLNLLPIQMKAKNTKTWIDGVLCAVHHYPNKNATEESLTKIIETITENNLPKTHPVLFTNHIKPELLGPTVEILTLTYGTNETL